MLRFSTLLLVTLATAGLASGGIVDSCDCASAVVGPASAAPCCGAANTVTSVRCPHLQYAAGATCDGSCCRFEGTRPVPEDEASVSRTWSRCGVAPSVPAPGTSFAATVRGPEPTAPRPQRWRSTPEGLGVFLI